MPHFIIWARSGLTNHWHDDGAALVRADTQEAAVERLREHCKAEGVATEFEVERVVRVLDDDDTIHVFPDAGCC